MSDFAIVAGLPDRHRHRVARIYCDAFAAKLGPFLGEPAAAAALLGPTLRPERALLAIDEAADVVLGVAGVKHDGLELTGLGWDDLREAFGLVGAAWRAVGLTLFERDQADGELLMDGIAVAADARGRGVGTALLRAVIDRAADLGLSTVRLDVVDTNPRARALYERVGFEATEVEEIGVLGKPFGFTSATTLVYRLDRTGGVV